MTDAVMFPGQGSQSVGMLSGFDRDQIADTLREASDAVDWDIENLIDDGPEDKLNQTRFTQPVLLAADVAIWRAWRAADGAKPALMAGHSLGEYAALVAAGALEFADAMRLVALRGDAMQQAVPEGEGGMAAVLGMNDDDVTALCARCTDGLIQPANFNAPGQVVVAGDRAGLAWLEAEGPAAGAKRVMRLPVSVPSHCRLMEPAADQLAEALANVAIQPPEMPVLHNLDAASRDNPDAIREALVAQLSMPVQWTQTMARMASSEVDRFIECGPGSVLCGLAKRGARGMTTVAINSSDAMTKALDAGTSA